jgi:NADPH:quinone reductase-like Zn-dependent oxidoreductase
MDTMHAALVTDFAEPPHYREVAVPVAAGGDHQLVDVLAVGLHPRVRSGASGTHYTSNGVLPMIPGVDGIGQLADGSRVFFVADDELPGPMAEKTVIDVRRSIRLPADVDITKLAAAMNPAMSSWVALRRRVPIEAGQSVLILGATGNAGTMAVQVAKLLGAGHVVGAGRDRQRLDALVGIGADAVVQLTDDVEETSAALAAVAADVDIVVDYLWGRPAQDAIVALLTDRADRSRAMNWIQIGAMAGPTIELPSVALRSSNFRLQGNGQGAVSTKGYLAELPSLIDEISSVEFECVARAVPLAEVETAWTTPDVPGQRVVITI